MIDLYEDCSEKVDVLFAALVAARAEFPPIKRDGYNPHFKSKFSTLKAVQEATEPILTKHGLSIMQFPSTGHNGEPSLTTWLIHSSGQYLNTKVPLSLSKRDPQSQGSAITYMRRYAWSAVLGLVTDDDDDGNSATLTPPHSSANMSGLVQAAQRAGRSREDVEGLFAKKYGKKLDAGTQSEVDSLTAWLTEQAAGAAK